MAGHEFSYHDLARKLLDLTHDQAYYLFSAARTRDEVLTTLNRLVDES